MVDNLSRQGARGATDEKARVKSRSRPRLLYLIKRSYAAAKVALEDVTRVHGMTSSDYTMLSFLHRLEPCSAADLARAQKVTPQAATQQVAQLIAKGLVTRRESEENRRISLISMTPQGRTSLAEVSARARQMENEVLEGLSDEECDLVLGFLARSAMILGRKERSGNE